MYIEPDIATYANELGADVDRLKGIFQRSLKVTRIVHENKGKDFFTIAEEICQNFGFVLDVPEFDLTSAFSPGFARKMENGSIIISVARLTNSLTDRIIFYHELGHSLIHMNFLPWPVKPLPLNKELRHFVEAEAWFFSVACALNDEISDTRELLSLLQKFLPMLPSHNREVLNAVTRIFRINWIPILLPSQEKCALSLIKGVDKTLIQKISEEPRLIYKLHSDQFEDLIAEVFRSLGYEVEQTGRTRDGGVDIFAVKCVNDIFLRFLIECKRYEPERKVGIGFVRSLFGVKMDIGASKAIIATTSYFTKPAHKFAEAHKWDLELKDYEGVMAWIKSYLASKKSK